MKYAVGFLLGTALGAALFVLALYYNPFSDTLSMSPLAVSDQELLNFTYSAVPSEAIAFTNDGESRLKPYPEKIAELWEPTIQRTRILVTVLEDRPGSAVGIGVKFSSDSEATRLLTSQALVESAWHIYLPGRGTLFVDQTENLWSYIRNIVIPARWNAADNWRGTWFGIMTVGPGALGTARVTGGSGRFADMTAEAVESWSAKAYSALQGPVAMTGNVTIALSAPAP